MLSTFLTMRHFFRLPVRNRQTKLSVHSLMLSPLNFVCSQVSFAIHRPGFFYSAKYVVGPTSNKVLISAILSNSASSLLHLWRKAITKSLLVDVIYKISICPFFIFLRKAFNFFE